MGGTLRIVTPTLSGSATLRSASTLTWDGGRGSANWDAYDGYAANQSNWNLNNVPSSSFVDNLTFAGSTQTTTSNNVSGLTIGSIVFASGASAFTNSGNSLTLNGDITNSSSSLQTMSHAVVLSSGTHGVDASSGSLTIGGAISGSGGVLDKRGANALVLSASNSHSGGTTLTAGTLRGGDNAAFGTGALKLNAGTITGTGSIARTFANDVSVGGNVTFGDVTGTGAITFSGSINLGSTTRTLTVDAPTTFSGVIADGSITKAGSSVLTLAGDGSALIGTTTVSAGTLRANGLLGGTVSVASGATLAGSGSVGLVSIDSGATLSPGNSPGTLTTGSMSWAGGGNYNWQLYNATSTAGTGWDLISGTGALTINATSGDPFKINLWTLSGTSPSDTNGNALNFDSTTNYTWKIATFTDGITGFATDKFTINTSATNGTGGFANAFTGGTFSLAISGNDLNLLYTAPASTSWDYVATGGNWSTGANWSPATVPSGTVQLSFSGGGGTSTNDLSLAQVSRLTFTGSAAAGYTITGNAIALGAEGITNNSGFDQAISGNVTLAAPATLSSATTGVALTLSGTLDTAGNSLSVTGSGNTSLAAVTGTGGFTKTGSGTATLTGAVAAPSVTLSAGSILLGGSNLLGDTATVTVSGGTLDLQSNADTVGSFSISGGTLAGAGTLTASTYALTGGAVNASLGAGTLTANSGAATLNGTSGAGTINVGGGTLTTGGANLLSDSAAVTLSSGGLTLGGSDTVGSFSISGGSLGGTGSTLTAATYSLGGGTIAANLGAGAATASSGSTALNGTLAGSLTVSGGTVSLGSADRVANASVVTISSGSLGMGAFNDAVGSFTISGGVLGGSGTLTATTYALDGGTVTANLGSGGATASSGSTSLNGTFAGDLTVAGGTVALGAADRVGDSSAVTITSGSLGMGTFADTVGSFTISGGAIGGSGTLSAATYDLNGGTVAANLGSGTVTVSAGATTLVGTSAADALNVTTGTLIYGSNSRIANTTNVTIAGGVIDTTASNFSDTVGTFAMSAGSLDGGGTISASTYTLTGGTVNANLGSGTMTVNSGAVTLAGTSSATVVNVGGGALTTGGVDRLANNATVTLSSGGLTLGGNDTVGSFAISGGTLDGAGTLTATTYALTGGTVNAALGAGAVNVTAGSTVLGSPGRLNAAASVNISGGQLTLGGNETVGTYTQSAGTLAGTGTLTAASYAISGGTLAATLGSSGTVSLTGGGFVGSPGQTIANPITIGSVGFVTSVTLQAWDFTGQSSPATMTATTIASDLTSGASNNLLTRGSGAPSSTGGNSFRTQGFQNNGISTANTDYFQWTVVSPTTAMQLNSIDAQFVGTASFYASPGVTYQYAYSTDGSTFTLIGSPGTTTTTTGVFSTDLSGVSALSNIAPGTTVTFRYYASGQTTSGGWGFSSPIAGSNGLALNGKFDRFSPASAQLGVSSAGAATYSGNVAVTGTAELTAVSGGTATFSGIVSGSSGVISKTGAGTVVLSGLNTYGGGVNVSAGTLMGTTDSLKGAIANSAAVIFDQSSTGTYAGAMSGAGSLAKIGTGTVALTSAQSFTGPTTVSAGALALSGTGSLASSLITVAAGGTLDVNGRTGGMTLASGQTLAGTGNVSGLVVVGTNATVSPGNSPGTLNAGSMEFAAGGNYNWQIYDLNGPAGTGWDFISGTGSLNITAGTGAGQQFNINLWSLSGISPDVSGTVAGFNKSYDYRWKLAEFAGGITGFNADEFLVRVAANNGTGGFANDITIDGNDGTFSVAQGNPATFGTVDQLYIIYVAAPEPSAIVLAGLGLAAAGWAARRRRAPGRSAS